jgi:hypothetical protein
MKGETTGKTDGQVGWVEQTSSTRDFGAEAIKRPQITNWALIRNSE